MNRDILRRCRFAPYRPGMGPRFTLTVWATDGRDWRGQTKLGYRLNMDGVILFSGADFCGSPLHADDADQTIASLMGFLTLRPGDTDRDYFDNYTPAQLDFCSQHAESLACEVLNRFGED